MTKGMEEKPKNYYAGSHKKEIGILFFSAFAKKLCTFDTFCLIKMKVSDVLTSQVL